MTLFDDQGKLIPAPLTESVQIRVYRSITTAQEEHPESGFKENIAKSGQDFYEIRLSRPQLFANKGGGLRAVGQEEREFLIFQAQGHDEVEDSERWPLEKYPAILQLCVACHRGTGINSLNTREKLLKPRLLHDAQWVYPPRWWEDDGTIYWKQERYEWGLLNGYWRTSDGMH